MIVRFGRLIHATFSPFLLLRFCARDWTATHHPEAYIEGKGRNSDSTITYQILLAPHLLGCNLSEIGRLG